VKKTLRVKIAAALILLLVCGCAAPLAEITDKEKAMQPQAESMGVKQQSVFVTSLPEKTGSETITLECKVAHKLGCRYKGRIYPWNAWVEAMGYKSTQYAITDVIQTGNRAVATLVKR